MPSSISLPDLLGVLPDDARARILGGGFTRAYAGCRLVCTALRDLHDSSVAHASLILHESNAAAWQQGRVRSPLTKFTGCNHLELHLGHKGCERLVSMAFVGSTEAARQRITRLKVTCTDKYDMARVVETLAGRLPKLGKLEFEGPDAAAGADGAVVRGQLTLCTLAGFFPRLRHLVLPLPGLGARAACTQLRKLTMVAGETLDLTQAALEGLNQLQRLERLTLGRFRLRAGDEHLLTQLLTTRRPRNLLTLKLLEWDDPLLEVDFERPAGSRAQPEGRRGMRCVTFGCSASDAVGMQCADQLARAVLAAADQLQQPTVPELVVGRLSLSKAWRPPQYLQPGDPLPRLVARCGQARLSRLHGRWHGAHVGDPAPVLAVVRLMGLPRGLDLLHGWCLPQARSQELASRGAAVGAAEPAGEPAGGPAAAPAPFEPRQTRQMTRLQRQREQQLGMRSQQLQLDTATPEQVLLRAVDELGAEAAQAGANGGGGDGGSGAAGGRLVMLRGALPPRDAGSMELKAWAKGAVEHCVRLAVQERARQQPEMSRGAGGALRTAGPPSSAGVLERCWELIDATAHHVAAPAAGVLLLDCGTDQRAAELAALLPGAAGARSVERHGDTGSARAVAAVVIPTQTTGHYNARSVLSSRIVKVLMDMLARPEQRGGSGTSSDAGGGGGSSKYMVANEEALRQLLALDHGVKQLWQLVWL
ncbi:hypothetical protein HXX76_012118 [Chlamydomonas incerta]|uniref:Uncharacterized protein n=1 Tax=Chlamydomonas incerta TaxID=51695 RepID=A0A835SIK3_CHLIN|nr:hypothetical protein HXX76_012118 [Chlamydomonas incerta]|eukprot:KAG2427793.1 hypothetical protein HXX76_012118 [Chlamydomonas incerta]